MSEIPALETRKDAGPAVLPHWACLIMGLGIMAVAAGIEHGMGRVTFCVNGTIKFWVGDVNGPECSQQIADWYSFSHIIHGFLLYGLMHLLSRQRWSLGVCLVLAIFVEASVGGFGEFQFYY